MGRANGNKKQLGFQRAAQPNGSGVRLTVTIDGAAEVIAREQQQPGTYDWNEAVLNASQKPTVCGRVSHVSAIFAMAQLFRTNSLAVPVDPLVQSAMGIMPDVMHAVMAQQSQHGPVEQLMLLNATRAAEEKLGAAHRQELERLRRSAAQAQQTRDEAVTARNAALQSAELARAESRALQTRNEALQAQLETAQRELAQHRRAEARGETLSPPASAADTRQGGDRRKLELTRVPEAPALILVTSQLPTLPSIDRPKTWAEFLPAFDSQPALADRIYLTDKARKEIAEQRNGLLTPSFEALCVMAGPYHDMRMHPGDNARVTACREAFANLHLADESCAVAARNNLHHYTARADGQPFLLDRHLKQIGLQSSTERVLRVYHAHDLLQAPQRLPKVVVGKIPGHMPLHK